MDEPKPLDSLFKGRLFRIPDYQRGYACGREQMDQISLPGSAARGGSIQAIIVGQRRVANSRLRFEGPRRSAEHEIE